MDVAERIARRALELALEYPHLSPRACLELADAEDLILNGDPNAHAPSHVIYASKRRSA